MNRAPAMAFRMTSTIRRDLVCAESQFRKACEQVVILSSSVEQATQRYEEADEAGHKVLRYSIRLRLSVLEGVRNMFYEFAAKKAADIVSLQRLFLESGSDVMAIHNDSSDDDMDELMFSGSSFSADEFGHDDDDVSSNGDVSDDSFR